MATQQLRLLPTFLIGGLVGCGSTSPVASPRADVSPTEWVEAQEAIPQEVPIEPLVPLPALPPLAAWVDTEDAVYTVDAFDGRMFVLLEHLDETERRLHDSAEFDDEAVLIEDSERQVPERFRLASADGECEAVGRRAVVLTSHTMLMRADDPRYSLSVTHRFSAVEVDAACTAYFAISASRPGRFEWLEPQIEREFVAGQREPYEEGRTQGVAREPIGVRGRFGSYRFENHPTCDYRSAIEIHHRGRSTEFELSLYASRYGMLLIGSRAYFAELVYGRWGLVPVFSDSSDVPLVVRPATGTCFDTYSFETEFWTCNDAPGD